MTKLLSSSLGALLSLSAVLFLAPSASALEAAGCKANCSKGSCSSSNSAVSCGCCSDGTPYCGAASDCKESTISTYSSMTLDVVSLGGQPSADVLVSSLSSSLKPTEGSKLFVDAVRAYSSALIAGNEAEAEYYRLLVDNNYKLLEDGDGQLAQKLAFESLRSPCLK